MGFSDTAGYTPLTVSDIMDVIMENVNAEFGTSYTTETFVGTGFYKYFYALAQRVQTNEIKTAEILLKVQDYFDFTNETILNPKVTPNGLIDALGEAGYTASVKPAETGDAGQLFVCVDVDEDDEDYADQKLEICTIIKDYTVAGVVSQGTESETLTLTNTQAFDFKYALPDKTEIDLKLTVTLSRNNETVIDDPDDQKLKLMANIAAAYKLGKDFEPERYFTVADAPWASDIKLEYDAGSGYTEDIFEADFDELFVILLENITLIEV